MGAWKDIMTTAGPASGPAGSGGGEKILRASVMDPEARSGGAGEAIRRLSDLYDFAPVGYITLDSRGSIREANLTAARMLGVKRPLIINRPFAVFVERGGIRPFMSHLRKCRALEQATAEVPLKVKGGAGI